MLITGAVHQAWYRTFFGVSVTHPATPPQSFGASIMLRGSCVNPDKVQRSYAGHVFNAEGQEISPSMNDQGSRPHRIAHPLSEQVLGFRLHLPPM